MKMPTLLLVMSFSVAACDGGLKSPSDVFLIPQDQIEAITKKANSGDVDAVKRLIAHYEASSENDAIAEEWRAKARALGDAQELYYFAERQFTGARIETEQAKKREMLMSALKAAEQSLSSREDASTKQLIEEITRSLNKM
ncbi:hypothetical protein LAG73_03575 [Pseudoxanthomonas japonensis]|nr:hypothetical protein LAG73_03575 [Pseudoxanthomonas japonensis]